MLYHTDHDRPEELPTDCAAGRWIKHPRSQGGLDWQTPCQVPVAETIVLGKERQVYGLCGAHAAVLFDDLARVLRDLDL